MPTQKEEIVILSNKLKRYEKEQSQIEGELTAIDNQLEEIGISFDIDIDQWVEENKKELEDMRLKLNSLTEEIQRLFSEYEEGK